MTQPCEIRSLPRCAALMPVLAVAATLLLGAIRVPAADPVPYENNSSVAGAAVSRSGKYVAGVGQDRIVRVWELASGRELASLDQETPTPGQLQFSPDERTLALGTGMGLDDSGELVSWDWRSGARNAFAPSHGWLSAPSFDSRGRKVALIRPREFYYEVEVWDADRRKLLSSQSREGEGFEVRLSPAGDSVGVIGFHNAVLLALGNARQEFYHLGAVDLVFSGEGTRYATLGDSETRGAFGRRNPDYRRNRGIAVWNTRSGRLIRRVSPTASGSWLCFSKDSQTIVSGPSSGCIEFRAVGDGRLVRRTRLVGYGGHDGENTVPAPDGRFMAAASLKRIRVWDTRTGKQVFRFAYPRGYFRHLENEAASATRKL
jgi:WD40 repeat protein